MKASARARFFWPGMGAAISQRRRQCRACNEMAPSQSGEEAIPAEVPDHPFADICVDFFHHEGNNFTALCDRYSGFLSVQKPASTDFSDLSEFLCEHFSRFGVPETIESDGGPPFNSDKWRKFLACWGIRHRLSSAYYPTSNSRAERGVKAAKRMIRDNTGPGGNVKNDEVSRALLPIPQHATERYTRVSC